MLLCNVYLVMDVSGPKPTKLLSKRSKVSFIQRFTDKNLYNFFCIYASLRNIFYQQSNQLCIYGRTAQKNSFIPMILLIHVKLI